LQCGQRSGGLIVERRGVARVARRVVSSMRRSICRKAYHAGRRICKRVPVRQALDLQSHRRDCLATDLQSGGGVGPRYVAVGSGLGCWGGYRPAGGSRGAGEFGRVLRYAGLPKVRARWASAQLGSAAVFALRGPEPALSVLFCELSTGPKARAVPASGMRVPGVFAADRQAAAGQHLRLTGVAAEAPLERREIGFSRACW
jgi:hypothetical protein